MNLQIKPKVFYRRAVVDKRGKRFYPYFHVFFHKIVGDVFVAFFGFYARGNHGLIGNKEQGSRWNVVGKTAGKQGGRFHIYSHNTDFAKVFFEVIVVFPNPPVGGVDGAGPIVASKIPDIRRYRS